MSDIKIKEVLIKKFNRKTQQYDKIVNIFEKYKVVVGSSGNLEIVGPKAKFLLLEHKSKEENKPKYFFVVSAKIGILNPKIQGASVFRLDDNVLIPFKPAGTWGDARIAEIKGFEA